MMTNVILAVELGLKAIMTHAAFRETCCFKFAAGHERALPAGPLGLGQRWTVARRVRQTCVQGTGCATQADPTAVCVPS